jgi:stress response protein SCP2
LDWLDQTIDLHLKYLPPDVQTCRMVVYTDESFANASNLASQLGFAVCLVDDGGNTHIVHYGSQGCKRVTRSAMAAELYVLSYGFDQASLNGISLRIYS